MGIPITEDCAVEWFDKTDAVTYLHRPVVGDVELKLYEMVDTDSGDYKPFMPQARAEVDALKGKKWKAGEKDKEIVRRAVKKASEQSGERLCDTIVSVNDQIDLLITGWKSGKITGPADGIVRDLKVKPESKKPSQCMDLIVKQRFLSYVMSAGDEEKKEVENNDLKN